jgi:hypothetical protein
MNARMRIPRAFPGKSLPSGLTRRVDAGFPQEMRPNINNWSASRFKVIGKRSSALVVLAGLTTFSYGAAAQEFAIADVPSATALPLDQTKPKTIEFSDHRNEELTQKDTGLIRFEDWERERPLQKQFLNLFPAYVEPTVTAKRDGVSRTFKEKLHLYVADARFVLDRPAASIDLSRYATLPFLERIDPSIKHAAIGATETVAAKEGDRFPNRNPERAWCDPKTIVLCLHSRYKLEGKLPLAVVLVNKLREKQVSETLEFESEVRALPSQDIDQAKLAKLTGVDAPVVGAFEQNIFYVNEVMQFGRLLAVVQPHPKDPSKTIATVLMVLAVKAEVFEKKKELENVPVLRNLVPAQVLMGNSSFNTGNSISGGLPTYARNRFKAIAMLLSQE